MQLKQSRIFALDHPSFRSFLLSQKKISSESESITSTNAGRSNPYVVLRAKENLLSTIGVLILLPSDCRLLFVLWQRTPSRDLLLYNLGTERENACDTELNRRHVPEQSGDGD